MKGEGDRGGSQGQWGGGGQREVEKRGKKERREGGSQISEGGGNWEKLRTILKHFFNIQLK